MHDEDVARIVELEKFQKEVERVYPFTVDAIAISSKDVVDSKELLDLSGVVREYQQYPRK